MQTLTHQNESLPQVTSSFYYRVGSHNILMESDIQAEVLLDSQISPLPFSPAWCKGLVAVRGELYPLVDLHHILYGKPNPEQGSLLWLQPHQHHAIVVQCNQYPKPLKLSEQVDIEVPDDEALPSWIDNRLTFEQTQYLTANHETLINNLLYALKN